MRRTTRLAAIAALVTLIPVLSACSGSAEDGAAQAATSLPLATAIGDGHPHSLMVDARAPDRLWLGVHGGLYRSEDRGASWGLAGLEGEDAMNLAGARGQAPFVVAGHNVFERSPDGGTTWDAVDPSGLPNLDLHGFALRAGQPDEAIAAAAGVGLFRSTDGGASFAPLAREVGASVFGMSYREDGALFAADPQRGLLLSRDGGVSFSVAIEEPGMVTVAAEPDRAGVVVAGGDVGIVVSDDGGRSWDTTFTEAGVAAVALDPADPRKAYAVGQDGNPYRSEDAGRNWAPVEAAGA